MKIFNQNVGIVRMVKFLGVLCLCLFIMSIQCLFHIIQCFRLLHVLVCNYGLNQGYLYFNIFLSKIIWRLLCSSDRFSHGSTLVCLLTPKSTYYNAKWFTLELSLYFVDLFYFGDFCHKICSTSFITKIREPQKSFFTKCIKIYEIKLFFPQ